jgi:hypothetical protein
MPRGFKTPDFATFFGEDGKSTMEHIQRFTVQCSEGNQNSDILPNLIFLTLNMHQ